MNHYERLKVAHDAPAEVIRAAYRALAAKLHPDRQGGTAGPDDEQHAQMAALNMAYEVLIDPKSRREYDASLVLAAPAIGASSSVPTDTGEDSRMAGNTRVDLEWMVSTLKEPSLTWPPNRSTMLWGGAGIGALILVSAVVLWQFMGQRQMERSMSDQFTASRPMGTHVTQGAAMTGEGVTRPNDLVTQTMPAAAPAEMPPTDDLGGKRRPTVDELARMPDEELLRVLPTLDDGASPPANSALRPRGRAGQAAHPLDGKPLPLRSDSQLIDPLATSEPLTSATRR